MPLQPLYMAPGICKTSSPYSSGKTVEYGDGRVATGRYVDCNFVRFTAGFPEKLGGWINAKTIAVSNTYGQGAYGLNVYQAPSVLANNVQVQGIPRVILSWRDNNDVVRAAIGTDVGLYVYDGQNVTNITPLQPVYVQTFISGYGYGAYGAGAYDSSPTTAGIIYTIAGSTTALIYDGIGNVQRQGDVITIESEFVVNGVSLFGSYTVTGTNAAGGYFSINTNQTAYRSGYGGGTVSIEYTRYTLPPNPISTQAGSNIVLVSLQNNNFASVGGQIIISGAVAVGGINVNGTWTIYNKVGNFIYIIVPTTATGTAIGGGSFVSYSLPVALNPPQYSQPIPQIAPTVGWTLARYGQQLLANPIGGTIYVYDPSVGGTAYPLANAPANVLAMIVTPERFVTALGIGVGGLEIAWADQNDYTQWTTTVTNTAETGRTLQGGSFFVGGEPVRDSISLILTNRTCFQMNYSGDTFIYDTPAVGDNCGLIGPQAICASGETAYWMSDKDFWLWNGTPSAIPSDDIRDYVYKNLNTRYQNKCWAGMNRAKREVWFGYPRGSATECSDYVIYHIDQQCWTTGTLNRTAWTDADLIPFPVGTDNAGYVYYHETGVDAGGFTGYGISAYGSEVYQAPNGAMDSYIVAAPVDVSNGDENVDAFGFIPDFERLVGNISLDVNTQYYPNDPINVDGPYILTDVNNGATRVDLRSDGKLIGFKLESNVLGGDFRLGLSRADVQPSGARR